MASELGSKTQSVSSTFTERWLSLLAATVNSSACKRNKSEPERPGPQEKYSTDVGTHCTVPHACYWLAARPWKSHYTSPGHSFHIWKMSHVVYLPHGDLCRSCEVMWGAYWAQQVLRVKCLITTADIVPPIASNQWCLEMRQRGVWRQNHVTSPWILVPGRARGTQHQAHQIFGEGSIN